MIHRVIKFIDYSAVYLYRTSVKKPQLLVCKTCFDILMSSSVVNAILTVVHLNLYEITLQITSYCLRYNLNIKYEKTWHSTPQMGKEGEKKNNDHNKKNYYDDRIKRKETTLDASIAD